MQMYDFMLRLLKPKNKLPALAIKPFCSSGVEAINIFTYGILSLLKDWNQKWTVVR